MIGARRKLIARIALADRFLTWHDPRLAYALASIAEETHIAVPVDAPRHSAWQSVVDLVRGWNPGLRLAAGMAALLCIIGVPCVVFQNTRARSPTDALQG